MADTMTIPADLAAKAKEKGWPEDLQDVPSTGFSSSGRTPASHENMTLFPDGDETRVLEKKAPLGEDG